MLGGLGMCPTVMLHVFVCKVDYAMYVRADDLCSHEARSFLGLTHMTYVTDFKSREYLGNNVRFSR